MFVKRVAIRGVHAGQEPPPLGQELEPERGRIEVTPKGVLEDPGQCGVLLRGRGRGPSTSGPAVLSGGRCLLADSCPWRFVCGTALSPVEPRFDPDIAGLWLGALDAFPISERQRKIAEWNERRLQVEEWLPEGAAPPSDVADVDLLRRAYAEMADNLTVILHSKVPSVFDETPESLADVDLHLWFDHFPRRYARENIDAIAVPAAGAYLGRVMVRWLGGRWVPRRNLEETQVVIGDRAWLPFLRARRYMQSRQSLLDYSLAKLYREAERHQRGGNQGVPVGSEDGS